MKFKRTSYCFKHAKEAGCLFVLGKQPQWEHIPDFCDFDCVKCPEPGPDEWPVRGVAAYVEELVDETNPS